MFKADGIKAWRIVGVVAVVSMRRSLQSLSKCVKDACNTKHSKVLDRQAALCMLFDAGRDESGRVKVRKPDSCFRVIFFRSYPPVNLQQGLSS